MELSDATSTQAQTDVTAGGKKFPVMEIFGPTIQGEGAVAGHQTLFVRFGGCDYRCEKCDSMHAVLPDLVRQGAQYMTAVQIAYKLHSHIHYSRTPWVTFSGGNPAMHQLSELVDLCHDMGLKVAVETQGTIWAPWLHKCDAVTISPKGPGMGEKFNLDQFQVFIDELFGDTLHPGASVKVVIMDQRDIEFAAIIGAAFPVLQQADRFWLSLGNPYPPRVDGTDDGFQINELRSHYVVLLEDLMQDTRLRFARILPQVHVLIWGNQKGV